jgi:hypothetical protein
LGGSEELRTNVVSAPEVIQNTVLFAVLVDRSALPFGGEHDSPRTAGFHATQ